MTHNNGGRRCNFCWRPSDYPVKAGEDFHNDGCPLGMNPQPSPEEAMVEWRKGYRYGFDDNYIPPWRYDYYTASFFYGWRAGKADIDRLVDEVAQARYE
jgi:hypothetical protein